ncbi:MAG: response regulator, partial [Calditrichaeota bacterium]|nr:response regulator [Calditrichota bacterium]
MEDKLTIPPSTEILLVDDEAHIVKTMAICFEDLGFKTRACTRPLEALELIRRERFDLAFVDLK